MKTATLLLVPALILGLPAAAQAEPRVWALFDDAPQPYLQYGYRVAPDGGAATVGCSGRRGVMTVGQSFRHSPPRDPGATALMTLDSGPRDLTISARAGPAPHDQRRTQLEGDLAAASPLMATFGKTGDLRLTAYRQTVRLPPAPMPLVNRLMRLCGR
jgi:hypothetical protein